MKDSKLMRCIEALSKKELLRFGQFVKSPYYNVHVGLAQMADIIIESAPVFDAALLSKSEVFEKLFPGRPYAEQKVKHLMSDLYKLLLKFLAQSEIEADPEMQELYLVRSMRNRNLSKEFDSTFSKVFTRHESQPFRSRRYFFYQFQLEYERLMQEFQTNQRSSTIQMNDSIYYLDAYYLSKRLEYATGAVNLKAVLNRPYDEELLNYFLGYFENMSPHYGELKVLEVYYHILKLIQKQNPEKHYGQLLKLLQEHGDQIILEELKDAYIALMNYNIVQLNQTDDRKYNQRIFELNKVMLEQEVNFERGYLKHTEYKNIIQNAMELKEFDWTLNFIESYREKLEPQVRQDVYTFNLANYYLFLGDYDKTLELLQSVKFTDILYALDSRLYLLKIYFERREFEPLFSLIDSMRALVRRNKNISESRKKRFQNYLSILRRLAQLTLKQEFLNPQKFRDSLAKLKTEINQTDLLMNQTWLDTMLGKLEEADQHLMWPFS